jgi:hypothetical protein
MSSSRDAETWRRSLNQRVRASSLIISAKVTTISRDSRNLNVTYQVILEAEGAPLKGTPAVEPIRLTFDSSHPARPYLRQSEGHLTGARWIVFLRAFQQGPDVVEHFHVEPDSEAVREAIAHAKLDQL